MVNKTSIIVPDKHIAIIKSLSECSKGYKLILSDQYKRLTGYSEIIRTTKKSMLDTIQQIYKTNN